jgi:DNA-binding LacI/PurR family transcriptional regulator
MPRRAKLTMDDVARAANVSKQTVSAVINNKSGISEKTRVRFRRIMARLDYQPNLLAGSLRGQSSFTVRVVIPSITNPFYPEFVRGIEDEAQRYGYSLFLCNSDENPEKEVKYLQLLRRHRIAGLIAVTIQVHEAWTEALKKLAVQGVPVVIALGTYRPGLKVVQITVDDIEGFVRATSYLLDLGHDRIGMIMPPPDPNGESKRVTGFFACARVAGKSGIPRVARSRRLVRKGGSGWHCSLDATPGATDGDRCPQ